jgi:predicted nucleic acid-binding protein
MAVGLERLTVYDGSYLVLVRMLGCRLVTADRAFYDAL